MVWKDKQRTRGHRSEEMQPRTGEKERQRENEEEIEYVRANERAREKGRERGREKAGVQDREMHG